MFFQSWIFRAWYGGMMLLWLALFGWLSSLSFLLDHWFYPAIMVLGAFVAGLTPEGGGAVAFPVLSVFLDIDRATARDFSLMIQSVGMTSASVWILSRKGADLAAYAPVLWFVPVAFIGFVVGMLLLQEIPTFIIQALFLSLILTFALAYAWSRHRGTRTRLHVSDLTDRVALLLVLFAGGLCASLFGTGADIVLYTLLVTRFRMNEKIATQQSILLMAAVSVAGSLYRALWDAGLTGEQVQTWLCAYPVVLIMAPLGSYALSRVRTDWMLWGLVALNLFQMAYFNLKAPSLEKALVSGCFSLILFAVFWVTLARMAGSEPRRSDRR
ncbi:Sulfite exporter TauE/SafE [Methyloligella halotolerans]|uniref:Probable membrane transporter protein n=1 Tax=Methyloligella halotolerans TaxID=1177755 RepID=A0A1E2RUP8_9HYPH|nr:sulfite exporter TauE/SafE family protein [Methyloligella halotolerans]ODA65954.1 Sulfite exporter TauE/SafE [Methyloligella halotolerans]